LCENILYAPWRLKYILSEKEKSCIFCFDASDDIQHMVVHRSTLCFVILNLYPYNNGHLMVVPNRHTADFQSLSHDELHDMMLTTQLAEMVLKETYHFEGINIGMNLGNVAGAGVEEHMHIHLVPRWLGDTNFMTAVAGYRVIPEDFTTSATRLREQFELHSNKK